MGVGCFAVGVGVAIDPGYAVIIGRLGDRISSLSEHRCNSIPIPIPIPTPMGMLMQKRRNGRLRQARASGILVRGLGEEGGIHPVLKEVER